MNQFAVEEPRIDVKRPPEAEDVLEWQLTKTVTLESFAFHLSPWLVWIALGEMTNGSTVRYTLASARFGSWEGIQVSNISSLYELLSKRKA